ncbi:MAG: elongation factor Ts [Acidimicrobiales bacterium]|nr:MAG: elongation factor Ts [Acidimicrobiales bacterium]
MSGISAREVQELRRATGVGMMDAKRALEETAGDFEAAVKWLREQGLAKSAKLAGRQQSDGAVAVALREGVAALVELKAETDFAAKGDDFVNLTEELADLVAERGEDAVAERKEDIENLRITKKENIELGKVVRWEFPADHVVDAYVHRQDGRGKVGVLLEVEGDVSRDDVHQIALHIAFARPRYLSRGEVPDEEVERERETLREQARNEGKPEQAIDKIVEGRLTAWYKESVLEEQDLFGEKNRPVKALLGSGRIVRFALAAVGE